MSKSFEQRMEKDTHLQDDMVLTLRGVVEAGNEVMH
jgi:hypothetical protein